MHIQLNPPTENSEISLFLLKPCHVNKEYVLWLNDPVVNQFLESRFFDHTIESTKEFVTNMYESPNHLFLGIKSKLLDKHVGNIKLGPIDEHHKTGEIGIMIGDKDAWGKGIACMAISMISEIARKQLSLRKLTAGCYASNIGSRRTFEKAGFIVEAERKKQYLLNGQPEDIVLLGQFLS